MGAGIAQVAALGGYRTLVHDAAAAQVDAAIRRIGDDLEKGLARGKVAVADRDAALARLERAPDLATAAASAGFVIEAVVEDMATKQTVFRTITRHAPGDAIFATNTSDRVIGMHFFNPVPRMALVEVIRGLQTSTSTVERTFEVARRMGKEPVEVNEFPGFAVSRINAMIGNEAFYMLMEGVASAEGIDKALRLGLNHPMGPFELGDLVGWDIRLKVLEHLHATLGEKFRPCPLLVKYVRAGRLGRKTGRGVYEYSASGELIRASADTPR